MATVQSDIFQPSKFGSKYTVTLIPGKALHASLQRHDKQINLARACGR